MFLHLSVSHSVHRVGDVYPSMQWAGVSTSGSRRGCLHLGLEGCLPLDPGGSASGSGRVYTP